MPIRQDVPLDVAALGRLRGAHRLGRRDEDGGRRAGSERRRLGLRRRRARRRSRRRGSPALRPIVAVDVRPEKLELAERLGATATVAARADGGHCRDACATRPAAGADYAFEAIGREETIREAWECAGLRGNRRRGRPAPRRARRSRSTRGASSTRRRSRAASSARQGSTRTSRGSSTSTRQGDLLLDELVTDRIALDELPSGLRAPPRGRRRAPARRLLSHRHTSGTIPCPTRAEFSVTLERGWWERGAPGELRRPRARAGSAWSRRSSSSGMWQRMHVARLDLGQRGSSRSQISPIFRGQRVWKTQPDGGSAALGISPSRRMRGRSSPSSAGTADRSASVYGWCGACEDRRRVADLHHAAEVEDGDPVGQVADDAEVVRDEEVGDALLALEVDEQVQDRRLHRHVEGRRGLVAHDDPRVAGERARDGDALLQAAGELGRAGRRAGARRSGRPARARARARRGRRPAGRGASSALGRGSAGPRSGG